MQPNPLARVALTQLMTRIVEMLKRRHRRQQSRRDRHRDGDGDGDERDRVDIKLTNNSNNTDNNNKQQATVVKGQSTSDGGIDRNNTNIIGDNNGRGIGIGNVIATDATNNDSGIILSIKGDSNSNTITTTIHLCEAVIALMENIKQIEVTALIYIESKFIDKFLSEHLLRPEHVITLVRFMASCCQSIKDILNGSGSDGGDFSRPPSQLNHEERNCITVSLQCIDILLHQKFIWNALNQQHQQQTSAKNMPIPPTTATTTSPSSASGAGEKGCVTPGITLDTIDSCLPLTKCELNKIICLLLDVVVLSGSLLLENTIFYRKYKNALRFSNKQQNNKNESESFENLAWLTAEYNPKVIFLGKLIETKIGNHINDKGEYSNLGSFGGGCGSGGMSSSSSLSYNDVLDLKGINNQFDFISLVSLLFYFIF